MDRSSATGAESAPAAAGCAGGRSQPGQPGNLGSYPNGLKRELGLFSLTNIVIANMIGAGVLTLAGFLLVELPNPLLMMALWLIGGLGALCGAVCYGQLGAAFPQAGGEYVFLSRLFHPLAGFLSGWISFFVGFSAPIAAAALAFVEYMARAFPVILNIGIFTGPGAGALAKKMYAMAVIVIFTLVHRCGVRFGAQIQNGLTLIKIAGIILFVIAGFAFGKGNIGHLFQGGELSFSLAQCKSIGLSFLWIMFAYSGWNASAYIGSEARTPTKNLPRSLILGTAVVVVLYLAMNLLYVYAVPRGEISGTAAIAGLAAARLFGRSLEQVISVFIAFALFSSLSAYIMLGPRVYFSMAQDNLFFRFAADVHPRYHVPSKSILFQGLIACCMVLIGTFDQLLTYLGFALGIFPILAVLGVFKLRQRGMTAGRRIGFPLTPIFFITTSVLMLVFSFLERPRESVVAIMTLLLGMPLYYFVFRKSRN
ncbi:MAG: amino acid permease [Acidobacteria bacterium]|jgi:APA family basic amino acid/polyamine antiporter|nr:amino acid permease [Acidobacteriota bacterium]